MTARRQIERPRRRTEGVLGVVVASLAITSATRDARATPPAPPTPGYPEAVLQWGVQKGETCEDIARSLYGSPKLTSLLQRYNHIACKSGGALREGMTLVVPATATELPDARLRSMNPDVRARAGGGAWAPAATGMPLFSNYNVNTLDQGRADVMFVDRTRVFLAPNTLVVIYGTASQTQVSKTAPPAIVEVQEGEVKTGLAALRGDAVDVAIKGGGRVSAASRDTVVQRKGDRTTVAVFDGKAGVTSGGKVVNVPEKFGTRFVGVAPPAPPRPLPPPPVWAVAESAPNALAKPGAKGVVLVAWQPAPNALAYRVELLREGAGEPVIVTREEVPPSTTAFRGELAAGSYRLVVRVIDKEEYLGIAAEQPLLVAEGEVTGAGAAFSTKTIQVNPYGELELTPDPELEMSIDGGAFAPASRKIDLLRVHPKEVRLRKKGGASVAVFEVRYAEVKAVFAAPPRVAGGSALVRVTLGNVEGIEAKRIAPSARIRLPDGVRQGALTRTADGALEGTIAIASAPSGALVEIVDGRGTVLGSAELVVEAVAAPLPVIRFGAYAPLWQPSPVSDVLWSAPTAIDGAAVSAAIVKGPSRWGVQGQARGSGSIGPIGIDAAIRSDSTDGGAIPSFSSAATPKGAISHASAWLGVRGRVFRMEPSLRELDGGLLSRLEIAPLVRVALPVVPGGAPAQIEPALALGGGKDRVTWLVDLGGRARLGSDSSGTAVPKGQGYLLVGASVDAATWLRLHALADLHVAAPDTGSVFFRSGVELGLEAGRTFFGGVAGRLAAVSDAGTGLFTGALTLGYRAP